MKPEQIEYCQKRIDSMTLEQLMQMLREAPATAPIMANKEVHLYCLAKIKQLTSGEKNEKE